jgi:hypothetical protein
VGLAAVGSRISTCSLAAWALGVCLQEPPASPGTASSLEDTPTAAVRAVRDDLFEGLLSSSDDSDWEADMRREHSWVSTSACHSGS